MIIKHFTSTVFVVFKNKIFLHWHAKVKEWLPPGGHIELNEDPIETAIRETIEELGIEIQIVNRKDNLFKFHDVDSIPSPETILVEEVVDQTKGKHLHIDMIYYGKPIKDNIQIKEGWILVDKKSLLAKKEFLTPENNFQAPPQDVILLGLDAITKLGINVS
ncbi:MAG: DNA mismatch repair protein MutT [Chloroflexi bacterium]|nr:DNA mismatch repair protein MutT [Chloroflexota bacterium]|tara:strand:+ start:66 stop:551 length:486 start_codon:yes stop_codon:yes gene_type:complete